MTKKIIGIDLGTTNSCVSIMDNNQAKVIENQEGRRTTPSIVSYTNEGNILVGELAKRQLITNTKNTFFSVKRLIGKKYSEIKNKKRLPFKVVKHTNGDAWISFNNKNISPQQISSEILKKMKLIAEEFFGEEITEAVITVPAYFNDSQRQATKDAGKIAGLNVLRIINEPTAAALAFGLDKKINEDKKIVVYDLGGGTFDISIIEISNVDNEKQFEVLSTNGDTFLGGEDFDNRLVDYIIDEFKKSDNIDLNEDELAVQRIKEASEKAKIELSNLKETEVNIPYVLTSSVIPKHLNIKITRAKLNSLVRDLVEKTIETCKLALSDANVSVDDVDEVILVGGMTRSPLVQESVEKFFGKSPKKNINPDEAVAIGAAIQAQILSGSRKDILLLDVIPLSLGIETLGGIMSKMISKNSTIPTKHSQIFSTAENNQPAVTIKVFQGERELVKNNKLLGEFNLEGIRNAPKGVPQIEVEFDIDSNGILKVSALDKSTGIKNNITIKANSGLSQEEIENMLNDAKINSEKDRLNKELIETKNSSESLLEEVNKWIFENKNILTNDEKDILKNNIKNSEEKNKTENIDEIKSATERLNNDFLKIKGNHNK
ncbi:molecular chaperone DnaK [Candidatus Vidania fulgoroideorum]